MQLSRIFTKKKTSDKGQNQKWLDDDEGKKPKWQYKEEVEAMKVRTTISCWASALLMQVHPP